MLDVDALKEGLEIFNDSCFSFDEPTHKYTYKGENLISVTTLIGQEIKPKFDTYGKSKSKAEREGISQQEVLDEWAAVAKYGQDLGTACHLFAEYLILNKETSNINLEWQDNEDYIRRTSAFQTFFNRIKDKVIFLPPELRMFCPEWKIAGTMDAPFMLLKNNKIIVGDHKFNKELKIDPAFYTLKPKYRYLRKKLLNHYKKNLNGDFKHLPLFSEEYDDYESDDNIRYFDDPKYYQLPNSVTTKFSMSDKLLYNFSDMWSNDLTVYSVQLSIYSALLEKYVKLNGKPIKIDAQAIFHFGKDVDPNNPNKPIKCLNLTDRVKQWLDSRIS